MRIDEKGESNIPGLFADEGISIEATIEILAMGAGKRASRDMD